jgi:polysaccharide biosynthesis protein PelD
MISKSWRMEDMGLPSVLTKVLEVRTARLETLALTMIIPAIGFGMNAGDPFFLDNRFPWLVLAPFLTSQRYGFLFGMSSASFLICLLSFSRFFHWVDMPEYPTEQVVGMILITLITAEFHGLWQRKLQSIQNKYQYLNLRMNEFSRSYHILKGSHSQLEQQTANYTKSMRTSLFDLEKQMQTLAKHEGDPLKSIGDYILNLFSQYGSIQTATLYSVSENQKLSLHPIACLGSSQPIWPSNPLVREALKSGHVTSIQNFDEDLGQEILVVIPLIDVYQNIWGVVIVNEMPMFALQENTLDLLSLLGGHIGDLIQRRTEALLLSKDVWMEFEHELRCVLRDARKLKISAAMIVSITSCTKTYDDLMSKYRSELRGLDKVLSFDDSFGRKVIINLLPLTDENGLWDFLLRLGLMRYIDCNALAGYAGDSAYPSTNEDIAIYSWILTEVDTPDKVLSKIEQICHRNEPTTSKGDYSRAEASA